jgi:tetratricopeptide (TPR) repeat protein/predicted Ser/Thr protein kinase
MPQECPKCHAKNAAAAERCSGCDAPLLGEGGTLVGTLTPPGSPTPNDATLAPGTPTSTGGGTPESNVTLADTPGIAAGWSRPISTQTGAVVAGSIAALQPGAVLGNRYEILDTLGEGGMGAVYKARDRELERSVALKVIRPELAGRPDILQRFKQELILAREVTHRNVIRIFDLGEAEGIKFITMEFIEGQDLKSLLLQSGKPPLDKTIDVMQQACLALEAAHHAGVVHRDLKPQNIMLDKQGKVSVMDFGIARSMELGGMTQTGALVGTPEYMSPEQVRGEHPDARSDLFTLGIIFYELLTGKIPYQAETAMATMFRRTKERAIPVNELDRNVPRYINDIVAKCLEIDPRDRFQSAREVYNALEGWKSGATAPIQVRGLRWFRKFARNRVAVSSTAAALLLVVAGVIFRDRIAFRSAATPPAPVEVRSLAVLPFRNASGDSSLDWLGASLAAMLTTDVGQSSRLRTVPSDRVDQILRDLRVSASSELDAATLKRVSDVSNADLLLSGQFTKLGDRIRMDVLLRDSKRPMPVSLKAEAPNEKELLSAVSQLASSVQQNLALPSDVLNELRAKAAKPSSESLQALRYYNEGLQFARRANPGDASKSFEAAIQADPNFALAYAMLALNYSRLGGQENQDKADQAGRQATGLEESLSSQERYRVQAIVAQVSGDRQKAITAYENLAKASPNEADVHFDLGGLYETSGALDQAREQYARVLQLDPKYVNAILGAGRVEIRRNNPQGALDYLNRALSLAVEFDNSSAKGDALQAIGVAYKRMNKLNDALSNYQQALDIRQKIGNKVGIASTFNEIAQVQSKQKKLAEALKSYQAALQIQREIPDPKGTGTTLINLGTLYESQGKLDEALKSYREALQIQRDLGNEDFQALCMNNIGNVLLAKTQFSDALTYFQGALQLREKTKSPGEIAQTLLNLGETANRLGDYNQATDYYLKALDLWRNSGDKRGTAIASYNMGTLFEYQGRYGASLNSKSDAFKTFQDLKERSDWMAEIQGGYGTALAQVGRFEEAQKNLDDALTLARELGNNAIAAQTLDSQGDVALYQGNLAAARQLYERALGEAGGTPARRIILLSKLKMARVDVLQGRGVSAIPILRAIAKEANTLGLKHMAAETSVAIGQALLAGRQAAAAQKELQAALRLSDRLGLRALLAEADSLLARASAVLGNAAEAKRAQAEAQRLLNEIYKESGSDTIRQRKDLEAVANSPR